MINYFSSRASNGLFFTVNKSYQPICIGDGIPSEGLLKICF